MKIKTTRFGTITIEKEKIIRMPFGMLGFTNKKRFVVLPHKEHSPFLWYQCVDDPALAFVITSPFLFKADYEVEIASVLRELSWDHEKEDGFELYVVVNIPKDSPDKMTANLIGPVLINNDRREAVQMVISHSPYTHKFPLAGER